MMTSDASYPRPPIALIVSGEEWLSLSVETLFAPRGYAVLRAFNAAHALQRIWETPPDVIVISRDLGNMAGVALCAEIRRLDLASRWTPILLISNNAWPRDAKLEALEAGAWDTVALPRDGQELFLRVDQWVRGKLAADITREQGLLDPATGMYNAQGLLRRAAELCADAGRHGRAVGCALISTGDLSRADVAPSTRANEDTAQFAAQLRALGRASDTLGRLSHTEFVVLAPQTDPGGVVRLAERLKEAIEQHSDAAASIPSVRIGCYAVSNFRDAPIAPAELLIRAAEALRSTDAVTRPILLFGTTPLPS